MREFTENDVFVAWRPNKKHCAQRQNLNLLDVENVNNFFTDALYLNKSVLCLVGTVQKYINKAAPRYTLNLKIAAAVSSPPEFNERLADKLKSFWRIFPWETPREMLADAVHFEPVPFGPIIATFVCTHRHDKEADGGEVELRLDQKLLEPRIHISPPYGAEYIHELGHCLNVQDLTNWISVINIAVRKVHKEFVDIHGKLV